MQLLVRLSQSSSSIIFFSTQRERKLNGSSLIVALVSLFSFLKATKCIAFHSSRLDVSTVSIVSQLQLLYESTRLRLARTRFRDWSVKTTLQIQDHIISKDSTRYSKRSAWRCFWLLQFETILSRSSCVHLHNLHERIQTFEGCILNAVWKYIYNEAIQARNYDYIALLSLEWCGGGGENMINRE